MDVLLDKIDREIARIEMVMSTNPAEFRRLGLANKYRALMEDRAQYVASDVSNLGHTPKRESEVRAEAAAQQQRKEQMREEHGAKPDGTMDEEGIEYDAGEDRFALDPTDREDAAILQSFFEAAKPLGMTQEQIAGILDWFDDHALEIAMRADDPKNGDRIKELQAIQRKDSKRYADERLDLELSGLLRQKNRREKRGAA